jgi:hypothetical protein
MAADGPRRPSLSRMNRRKDVRAGQRRYGRMGKPFASRSIGSLAGFSCAGRCTRRCRMRRSVLLGLATGFIARCSSD